MVSYEKNDKGEITEKQRPQFAMSFARIICRIETRIPICLEKHETIEQMGRFTLRDEGLTLGSGKVLKYKPIKVKTLPDPVAKSTEGGSEETKGTGEQKEVSSLGGGGQHTISELIYDLETGETVSKEEYMKRQNAREELDNVDEEDYDEEDDENEDDEGEAEEGEEEESKPEVVEKIGAKKDGK